ncbi:MAG: sporulation protein YqfD [Anaeroplasmataceae bacterium]|nr:sporulation protein YqfD [Anaeroplasmataceae bacterium]
MIYKIKMKKDDYFKISSKIVSTNLEIIGEEVTFEIESGSFNILKRTNYEFKIIESLQSKLMRFFSRYGLLITGVLFFLSILYMNIYRVSRIEFNRTTPINEEIEYQIKSSYKKLLCFNFCSMDYKAFSKDLQKKYFEYPYINVDCKNNVVQVYIANIDDSSYLNRSELVGDIVSKKDGIVDLYYVYSGKSMVSKNKYVRAGDVLIEGNQEVSGLVLGTCYDRVVLSIPKTKKEESLSSEHSNYYDIKLFGHTFSLAKKTNFESFSKEESLVFNLFDFFSLKKIAETKKNAIIKTYDEKEALLQAEKIIQEDFKTHQTNDLEKIIAITNTKIESDEEAYHFTFIVKKYESMGEFSPKE